MRSFFSESSSSNNYINFRSLADPSKDHNETARCKRGTKIN